MFVDELRKTTKENSSIKLLTNRIKECTLAYAKQGESYCFIDFERSELDNIISICKELGIIITFDKDEPTTAKLSWDDYDTYTKC